jgi:2-hydroxychromene-2-carboxylate isomerase
MKEIRYFMTPGSPWTYLGHQRLLDLARQHGATITLRPIDLGSRVFPQSGGLPLGKRAPQRQAYRLVELERWRNHVGIPLNLKPRFFPVPADDASLLIIGTELTHGTDKALQVAGALMRAMWAEERDISDAATLSAIASENGVDGGGLDAHRTAAKQAYDRYTEEAIAGQVFGAPWYVFRDEPFWGQDRLDFLERALAADAAPAR